MRNPLLYVAAIVLGVLAILVGVFYLANIFPGNHHVRSYIAIPVGAVLIIIGIVGLIISRSRSQA